MRILLTTTSFQDTPGKHHDVLSASGFEVVRAWRIQQEHTVRAQVGGSGRTMSDAEIGVFIQHYERLTRHILADMPAYADLTLRLDAQREVQVAL